MAIMDESRSRMGSCMGKMIEEGAEDMVFQILQKSQYQYPYKSAVREIMSNGLDSVTEKKAAIEILSGRAVVTDYYDNEREGAIYKDSRFDQSYYDTQWLNPEDRVELRYIVRTGTRDMVIISDTGVGLGGRRLLGYLSLMYSTKRLSKSQLGKYGLGAKSALSTGEEFFTTESCYNGRKYRFNVYMRGFDSIIPRFNLATSEENFREVWQKQDGTDYMVYSEPTTELNGVKVLIEAKKHHRNEYLESVKSQMLYFDNVYLTLVHEDGREESIPFRADILYEDQYIVLAKQNYYAKPHILLNKVNYGYINFDELELEDKKGNIGIKVLPEEVEVNPNRESLVWGDITKQKILERMRDVQETATKLVQEQLQTNDFLEWYRLCSSISSWFSRQGDNVAARLANMVDIHSLKPRFQGDTRVQFVNKESVDPTSGLWMRLTKTEQNLKANKSVLQVKREQVQWLGAYLSDDRPVVILQQGERASNRRDKWLCHLYPSGFISVYEPYLSKEQAVLAGVSDKEYGYLSEWMAKNTARPYTRNDVFELIQKSSGVLKYADIVVPDNFKGTEEEEDKVEETAEDVKQEATAQQTAEERRKLEGKTVLFTPRSLHYGMTDVTDEQGVHYYEAYTMHKMEIPIARINEWDAPEIYYGFDSDRELLHCAAILSRDTHPDNGFGKSFRTNSSSWSTTEYYKQHQQELRDSNLFSGCRDGYDLQHYFDTPVMLVKIAQNNQKYYRDFLHISNFFMRIKDKKITMSDTLIRWNTARKIKAVLQEARFLQNFGIFNEDYANKFQLLQNYVDMHYRYIDDDVYGTLGDSFEILLGHLDNVELFQQYIHDNPQDHAGIAHLAGELFANRELSGGQSVDMFMVNMLREVIDFAKACGPLLNYVEPLATANANLSFELEQEIRNFLIYKNILQYGKAADAPADPGESPGLLLPEHEAEPVAVVEPEEVESGVPALV